MRWQRISIRSALSRAERRGRGRSSSTRAAVAVAVASMVATGCLHRQHPASAVDPAVAAIAAERAGLGEPGVRGKILYETYCAVCHGTTGAGDGFNASNLPTPPPDLPQIVASRGEALVEKVVRDGSGSTAKTPLCPPYGRLLDEADRQLIVAYVCKGLSEPQAAAPGK